MLCTGCFRSMWNCLWTDLKLRKRSRGMVAQMFFMFLPAGLWLQTLSLISSWHEFGRDSIGSSSVIGDNRWAGTYGVDADFVAKTHCSVEFIPTEAIRVRHANTWARTQPIFLFNAMAIWITLYKIICKLKSVSSTSIFFLIRTVFVYLFEFLNVASSCLGWGRRYVNSSGEQK